MTEYVEVRSIDGEYLRVADLTPQQLKRAARSYSWTSTRDMLSGRLCIQAYSPYSGTEWKRQWQEGKAGDFPSKIPSIIKELETASPSIAKRVEEAEQKAEIEKLQREQQREIERQRWEAEKAELAREEAKRRRIQAEKDSREELSGIINAWAKAKKIEEFFADAERRAEDLGADEKALILERLNLAREMVGSTDALQWFRSWKAPDER